MLRTLPLGQIPVVRLSSLPSARAWMTPFRAVVEGLACSRQYQRSRTRGLTHDAAIREAFGISAPRPHDARSICFAGKA